MYTALYIASSGQRQISLHESFNDAVAYLAGFFRLALVEGADSLYDRCEYYAAATGFTFFIAIDVQTPEPFFSDGSDSFYDDVEIDPEW